MNEKEAIDTLANCISDYVIGDYCACKLCPMENQCIDEECVFQQAIDTVLQALKDKNNRIDELEKALIDEDLKNRNKIKECEEENKKYLNAIKSILLNIPSNQIEINNKDIVQAEKYYVVVERNVINNSQKLCLYKGEY